MSYEDTVEFQGMFMYKDDLISELRTSVSQLLAAGILWGMHLCLTAQAVTILLSRGRGQAITTPRMLKCALVLVMMGLSTAYTIHLWHFERDIMLAPYDFGLANLCIATTIFLVSDLIVVWRAWVVWPGHRWVQGTLIIVSFFTLACAVPGIYLGTLRDDPGAEFTMSQQVFAVSMAFLPFLLTNIVATSFVAWKFWLYRNEVQAFLKTSVGHTGSGSRLGRVFMLLVEGGLVYTMLWAIYTIIYLCPLYASGSGDDPMQNTTGKFFNIWKVIMVELSAMYPAAIVTLISKFASQKDVVNGTWRSQKDPSPRLAESVRRPAPKETPMVSRIDFTARASVDTSVSSEVDIVEWSVNTTKEGDSAV